ncbi:signal recognition particle-docking protein FtsY [Salinisphaera shabanensis T35B1]|mgnify:CR=1 FL=1|jgi:fused signal recognition particle receptor|uniref:Signal recognition particle receptor FtsY n=1 Tax=Salinisphaera shabanensis E1L3A TaxID=1033802 RepID=U2EPF9_9GAMM|nr:signal recognition particle-docking protein FtsY [Salinisphaera shabanensis]ERJ19695.1 Signal recognition particle receptor FtsY protein [Salinisphaera shabanensis E1L3A]
MANVDPKARKSSKLKQPGFFTRMRASLNKGDSWLTYDLRNLLPGETVDQDALDELETQLLLADVGVEATGQVMNRLQVMFDGGRLRTGKDLGKALREHLGAILTPCEEPLTIPEHTRPFVILMVGVNGVGKTTTIGKLAKKFQDAGQSVMLAAGDTFRAAAVEQLQGWGERNHVPVVAQGSGADSASVVFDAYSRAKARGIDVLIADTAGRLHTQGHLMDELKKIKRVLGKQDEYAPHEVMLVVDATTGGNALQQAVAFNEAVGLTGITITKLDGTASGGIVFAIAKRLGLPLRFIGIGEKVEDLGVFESEHFMDALFDRSK